MLHAIWSPIWSFLKNIWAFVDALRRALFNLILLLILVAIVLALVFGGESKPKDKTTLMLTLKGSLVEEFTGSPRDHLLASAQGESVRETRLRDVLDALKQACKDDTISQVVLDFDNFGGGGMAQLREVGTALNQFKACNKPVLSYADEYAQAAYFLAAHGSEVHVHPMGGVMLEGFGRYRNYYKDALDRLGITVHLLRVGTYKSFGEPYIANGPSPAAQEADAMVYDALWNDFVATIEAQRKLQAGSIMKDINTLPERLKAAGGDAAKLDLEAKLVDAISTRDQFREVVLKRGAQDDKKLRTVTLSSYVHSHKPLPSTGPAVGIVVAEGEIVDGHAAPGTVGGDSTAKLVRQARENDRIKALVLRINSPGGSALASEIVRRELELTQKAGKPVVVSMGDVAASGGYWISMSSDRVLADRSTITGSIGVFGLLPTAEKAMEKLSLHTGGYTTTWIRGGYDLRRGLDPRMADAIQSGIQHIYTQFITQAAAARKTTPEKLDAVAQGRVWSGHQAKERGLVDELGGLQDAIQAASSLAKLTQPEVQYIEPERGRFETLMASLGDQASLQLAPLTQGWRDAITPPEVALAQQLPGRNQPELRLARQLLAQPKPFNAVVHCLCSPY